MKGGGRRLLGAGALSAAALLLACVSDSPSEVQLRRGEMALAVGDPEDAILAYRVALDHDPRNAEALHGLARAHVARGDAETALGIYAGLELGSPRTFVRARGDYLEALDRAAAGRLAAGDPAGALRLLERIRLLEPTREGLVQRLAAARVAEGDRLVADGRVHLGEALYQEVLAGDPASLEAVLGLARALIARGAVDDAIRVLSDATLSHPDDPSLSDLMDRAIEIRYPSTPASPSP